MKVGIQPVTRGSCSFCDRGKLSSTGMDIDYPYDEVIVIETGGSNISMVIRACGKCKNELVEKLSEV